MSVRNLFHSLVYSLQWTVNILWDMAMNNTERIKNYLVGKQTTVSGIAEYLGILRQAVHRILNNLITEGSVVKAGRVWMNGVLREIKIQRKCQRPTSRRLTSIEDFGKTTLSTEQGSEKRHLKINLPWIRFFYSDFYSIEIFGKTRLGQELLYSKQGQDRELMNLMIDKIKPAILGIIKKYRIDGIMLKDPNYLTLWVNGGVLVLESGAASGDGWYRPPENKAKMRGWRGKNWLDIGWLKSAPARPRLLIGLK